MPSPPSTERQIWDLLQNFLNLTQSYWSFAKNVRPSPIIHVPWNMDVTLNRNMTFVERLALQCLKDFENCFVRLRHIEPDQILLLNALASKNSVKYSEELLINYESEEGSSQDRLESRHYEFKFELDHCVFYCSNKDFVPCINLVAKSSRKP